MAETPKIVNPSVGWEFVEEGGAIFLKEGTNSTRIIKTSVDKMEKLDGGVKIQNHILFWKDSIKFTGINQISVFCNAIFERNKTELEKSINMEDQDSILLEKKRKREEENDINDVKKRKLTDEKNELKLDENADLKIPEINQLKNVEKNELKIENVNLKIPEINQMKNDDKNNLKIPENNPVKSNENIEMKIDDENLKIENNNDLRINDKESVKIEKKSNESKPKINNTKNKHSTEDNVTISFLKERIAEKEYTITQRDSEIAVLKQKLEKAQKDNSEMRLLFDDIKSNNGKMEKLIQTQSDSLDIENKKFNTFTEFQDNFFKNSKLYEAFKQAKTKNQMVF